MAGTTTTTDDPLLSPEFLRRLEQLELAAKKILAGRMKGDRLSRRKGRGSEFADYRPYTIGDDLRFLDWNLFGRVEKLFLKLYREEEDLHVYLLIDNTKSMDFGSPSKLRYAKQIAAALGFIGLANMDRIVIESVGGETIRSPQFRGRQTLWRMMKHIEAIPPAEGGDLNSALRGFSTRAKGQGIAVVLSDFLDKGGYEEGLKYLAARNLDVYAIQILSQEEIQPPYTGDLKLTDLEDDDFAEITISAPLLARYQQTLAAYRGALSAFCLKRGLSYYFTSNQVPFEKLVLGYLRDRGMVR